MPVARCHLPATPPVVCICQPVYRLEVWAAIFMVVEVSSEP